MLELEARYSEGVLDARLGPVRASSVSSSPVEARSTGGCGSYVPLPRAAQQVACVKSRAPRQPRVADQLAYSKSRSLFSRGPFNNHCPWPRSESSIAIRGHLVPGPIRVQCPRILSQSGSRPFVTVSSPEDRSTAGVLSSDPRVPTTVAVSSSADRSTAGN